MSLRLSQIHARLTRVRAENVALADRGVAFMQRRARAPLAVQVGRDEAAEAIARVQLARLEARLATNSAAILAARREAALALRKANQALAASAIGGGIPSAGEVTAENRLRSKDGKNIGQLGQRGFKRALSHMGMPITGALRLMTNPYALPITAPWMASAMGSAVGAGARRVTEMMRHHSLTATEAINEGAGRTLAGAVKSFMGLQLKGVAGLADFYSAFGVGPLAGLDQGQVDRVKDQFIEENVHNRGLTKLQIQERRQEEHRIRARADREAREAVEAMKAELDSYQPKSFQPFGPQDMRKYRKEMEAMRQEWEGLHYRAVKNAAERALRSAEGS